MDYTTEFRGGDEEAWDIYVGQQTAAEFLENGGAPVAYMNSQFPDMALSDRNAIAERLQRVIDRKTR